MEDDDRTIIHSGHDPLPLPSGHHVEEFEIKGQLGQGGFSIVYRAWDESLHRMVALKEYMPIGVARRTGTGVVAPASPRQSEAFAAGLAGFVKEGQTLAQFDHASLVKVHRTFKANGTAFMVMQLVEGATLKDTVSAMAQPPDERWLLKLLDPLTAALQVVHQAHIYHRDIAPDNIMILAGSGRPLLLDFGAARQLLGDAGEAPTAMLKAGYAPVEQYPDSPLPQGPWTDIYALAGVVYWAIARSKPPEAVGRLNENRDLYEPLAGRASSRYNARFLRAIDHALKVWPQARPQSVASFRKELGLPEEMMAPQATAPARPSLPASRARWLAGGLAAAAVAVAGVIWVALALRHPQGPPPVREPGDLPVAASDAASDAGTPVQPAPRASESSPQTAPPIDPAREFERILQSRSTALQVAFTVDSPSLRAGTDPLLMQLRSSADGYFYVLLHDTDGQVRILFPNAAETGNRISAGVAVRLPPRVTDRATGMSETTSLLLSEPVGPARLLALVSPRRLDFDAVTLAQSRGEDYRVLVQGPPPAELLAATAHRPLYAGLPVCDAGASACSADFGAAAVEIQVKPR